MSEGIDLETDEAPRISDAPIPRQVQSPSLLRGQREIVILHRGTPYRLRITKGDKLILTK